MLLNLFISIYALVISALYFFLPLYLKGSLGFSGARIGLLYAVLSITSLLVSFPVGITGDRYPARLLTQAGLGCTAASLWGLAAVRDFWPFLAVFWLFGLSLQLFRQSLDILLFKANPGGDARRFGGYNAWRMSGMLVGILLGGLILQTLPFPALFRLFGLGLGALFCLTFFLPRTRGQRVELRQYGRDFRSGPVLFFALWLFLFTLHWGAEGTSLGLFLQSGLGLTPWGMGLYLAGEFGTVALCSYVYGRFLEGRLPPLVFLILGLAASGLGHVCMTLPPLYWSFAWRLVHGVGDGLIAMLTYTTIARLFHVDRIGGNSGLISLTTTLGVLTGSLIFGPLGAAWGYGWPLIISGALSLALIPLVYLGLRE
ncbi:MAG: MFS transporter [Syntrophobacterales bacterium]|nr:MFS transporter [Syntrophobacterales bacterium]